MTARQSNRGLPGIGQNFSSVDDGGNFGTDAAVPKKAPDTAMANWPTAFTTLPGVVFYQRVVRPDGEIRYTYISEGARDLFGVSAEEILADPQALFGCHSEEYKSKFRQRLLSASKTLTTWDVEASIVTPEGSKKYTHAIARPERQSDGSVLWTGVILDETRTRAAVYENLAQGLLLYDSDDRLILRNSHFLQLYPILGQSVVPGVTYEDVTRMELASIAGIRFEEAELIPEFYRRIEEHRDPHTPHTMYEREIGNGRWVLVNEHRTGDGGTVVLYTDISELKRRDRDLQHLAHHDALTGLPNRQLFQQRVDHALANARGQGVQAAVMCLDLDYFKNVNDTLGHPAGDVMLKCVAERLRSCFRDADTVARIGGDEFAIVLPNLAKPEIASALASRLIKVISQPVDFNGQQMVSGLSIGIAISPTDGENTTELVKNADLALYRAKSDGRGTFRFFEAEMDARAQARRALEVGLRQSLVKNELEIYYQPQIDLYTNRILAFEALVRWRHPEKGLILPAEFIPLAEETGIIVPLGNWVLHRACLDALLWPKSVRVAVNVSPVQFRNQNLAQTVADIIKETTLDPKRLELEITESVLLRDVQANLRSLHELKSLGVQIAMDDFGTGYSSISNLRSFPFDKIKIDRSFVGDLGQELDAAAIVHAVVGLGNSLGMTTCAEGVETKEQLRLLRQEGCCEVQGYYYGKPMPLADVVRMIEREAAMAPPIVPGDSGEGAIDDIGTPSVIPDLLPENL